MAINTDLLGQIKEDKWVKKESLDINDMVLNWIKGNNSILQLEPMQSLQNSALGFIIQGLTADRNLDNSCGLYFLETAYAINLAYNSDTVDLMAKGNRLLTQITLDDELPRFYRKSVSANNLLVNLMPGLPNISDINNYSVPEILQNTRESLLARLDNTITQLEGIIAPLLPLRRPTKKQRRTRYKNRIEKERLEKIKERVANSPLDIRSFEAERRDIAALVPIAAGGAITTTGVLTIIHDIAAWLLSNFFTQTFIIPVSALAWTVTSIVAKTLGIVGGEVCKYFAAAALRLAGTALPTIIAPSTGLFIGVWTILQAYAPFLIMAAVIIGVLMKRRTTVGEYLYVVGKYATGKVFSSIKVDKPDEVSVLNELKATGEEIKREKTGFTKLFGVSMTFNDEVTLAIDLLSGMIIDNQIATVSMAPWLPVINGKIPPFMLELPANWG